MAILLSNAPFDANQQIVEKHPDGLKSTAYLEDFFFKILTDLQRVSAAGDHFNLINIGVNSHVEIDSHIADTGNPHVVTFSQAVVADPGTDITPAEAETLTDGSDADALHTHPSLLTPAAADLAYLRLDATNGPLTGPVSTQDIYPDSPNTRDVGALPNRFRDIFSQSVNAVEIIGTGNVEVDNGAGIGRRNSMVGRLSNINPSASTLAAIRSTGFGSFVSGNAQQQDSGGGSTSQSILDSSGNGAAVIGSAQTVANGGALINATSFGSTAMGYAFGQNAGQATLLSSGLGTFAQGFALGILADSRIRAIGSGSFAQGFSISYTPTPSGIRSDGPGSFAQGFTTGGAEVVADQVGSFAQGRAQGDGSNITCSSLGGFAQGSALVGGSINTISIGAFAQGSAVGAGALVRAANAGAFAQGHATAGQQIIADAANAAQFGPGTNNQPNSLQVGAAGIRLMGVSGAAAVPQDGDLYLIGPEFHFRSNGAIVGPWNQPSVTGSRAGNAALASLLTQLAAMNIITDNTVA